jgi:2-phosphosulfolactate phosphatase
MYYEQSEFDVRCEWGLCGIRNVGALADAVVIVDVLSFSTCVDVAVGRGAWVFPYRWKDDSAKDYARQLGAELAAAREKGERFSLSPASMRNASQGTRIVLPSPNGSELSAEAAALGKIIIAGCFRNCRAVAKYAAARGGKIALIPAGERWPDGSLRPAVEDLAAAGAIIAHLSGTKSPEAKAAAAVWEEATDHLGEFLASCASGRELIERKYEEDIRIAGDVDVSSAVPLLRDGAFVCAQA